MHDLTENEALRILPAVVDNEASQDERDAFFAFISKNAIVRNEYHDALLIKKLLAEKLQRRPAPDHLRTTIYERLREIDEGISSDVEDENDLNNQKQTVSDHGIEPESIVKKRNYLVRYLSAAAVLLIFTLVTFQILNKAIQVDVNGSNLTLENVSLKHFINSSDENIEFLYKSASTTEAEQYLADQHQFSITIPQIAGADFAGIVMAEFVNNFSTPLLKYQQLDINENIFLFAFTLEDISGYDDLSRNSKAVEICLTNEDFYITEIDNFHVVSWLWDDIWYTAVSNHNGYDLASLVEPLNYSH